jgi:hypothetical protein
MSGIKKELQFPRILSEIVQYLGLTLFQWVPLSRVVTARSKQYILNDPCSQLSLLDLLWDSSDSPSQKGWLAFQITQPGARQKTCCVHVSVVTQLCKRYQQETNSRVKIHATIPTLNQHRP